VDHNLIDGSQEDMYAISGTDYVMGDPLFADAPAADFHLQRDSPAIDKGSSHSAPTNDFDGHSRPYGAGYHIGADEYIPTAHSVCLPIILKVYVP
jgi:hypothetical protein